MQTKHNVIFSFMALTQVFTCLSAIITNYLTDLRGADEILLNKLDSVVLHEDSNNFSFFHLTSDQSVFDLTDCPHRAPAGLCCESNTVDGAAGRRAVALFTVTRLQTRKCSFG